MFQTPDLADLAAHEHCALMRLYAETQLRCSTHISEQHRHIQQLQTTIFQLRAQAVIRETALCWERETRLTLQAQLATWYAAQSPYQIAIAADAQALAADTTSQRTTELLICQTGCVLDDNHWRDNDQCKRTGKPCLLAAQPQALDQLRAPHHPSLATESNHENAA